MRRRMNSSNTAPTVAGTMALTQKFAIVGRWSTPHSHVPTNPPMIPIMMLPIIPDPPLPHESLPHGGRGARRQFGGGAAANEGGNNGGGGQSRRHRHNRG